MRALLLERPMSRALCGLAMCVVYTCAASAQEAVWLRLSAGKIDTVYSTEAEAMQLVVSEGNENLPVSCLEYEQAPPKERQPLNDNTASAGSTFWCQERMYRWIQPRQGEGQWIARRDRANNACQAVVNQCGQLRSDTVRLALYDWVQKDLKAGVETAAKSGDLLGASLNEQVRLLTSKLAKLEEEQAALRKALDDLKKPSASKPAASAPVPKKPGGVQ